MGLTEREQEEMEEEMRFRNRSRTPVGSLDELQIWVGEWAAKKGWLSNPGADKIPELIALMHSELSEALEEYRNGRAPHITHYTKPDHELSSIEVAKPEGIPSEMADVVIRILHFCANFNFSLHDAIVEKMKYNEARPYRHGGKII